MSITISKKTHGSYEPLEPSFSNQVSFKIQKLVDYLLLKNKSLEGVIDRALAKEVMIDCSKGLFKAFAKALQKSLAAIDLATIDKIKELHLDSIISLIPYCYPEVGDRFLIPFRGKRASYDVVCFSVEKVIALSFDECLTPFKAYSLTSSFQDHLLVFLGTTFPSADGFLNSLMSDFTPFASVGAMAYKLAFRELKDYFHTHRGVHVYGKSLGGSLALHTFRDFESSIDQIHAVAPPGLHAWDRFMPTSTKKVVIITHEGDFVSQMGYFPEHDRTRIYQISLKTEKFGALMLHALALTGAEKAELKLLDPKKVNQEKKRVFLSALHVAFSCLFFTFLLTTYGLYKVRHRVQKAIS